MGGAANSVADAGAILKMKQMLFVPHFCLTTPGRPALRCVQHASKHWRSRPEGKAMHKPNVMAQALQAAEMKRPTTQWRSPASLHFCSIKSKLPCSATGFDGSIARISMFTVAAAFSRSPVICFRACIVAELWLTTCLSILLDVIKALPCPAVQQSPRRASSALAVVLT